MNVLTKQEQLVLSLVLGLLLRVGRSKATAPRTRRHRSTAAFDMQELTFESTTGLILAKDPRYQRDAALLKDALDHTQKLVLKENKANSALLAAANCWRYPKNMRSPSSAR